jgi:hypothetical protein
VFSGRKALLAKIARYATPTPKGTATSSEKGDASIAPLVILGEGGSGKSSLLARAVKERTLQPKPPDTVVLQRYIGGVPGTESLMTMLTELTADITSLYGHPEPTIPESARSLAETFQAALYLASAEDAGVVAKGTARARARSDHSQDWYNGGAVSAQTLSTKPNRSAVDEAR